MAATTASAPPLAALPPASSAPPPSTTPTNAVSPGSQSVQNNNSVRKGRGSQVFTQEMACTLVELYYARKKDFPGAGYSLPPEGFEAIAAELRTKYNVTPNEIDQQTLKKKLSNIRTRVRNRCRDLRPGAIQTISDEELTAMNLTPSEKIYFRFFGVPSATENRGDSGSSTPLPNGVGDVHEPNGRTSMDRTMESALNEAAIAQLMRIYAESLDLFTARSATLKNIHQRRMAVYENIQKQLRDDFHVNMEIDQIRQQIDDVVRSLAHKVEEYRRFSGLTTDNNNIVLRPTNLTQAEAELFDAQFTESNQINKRFDDQNPTTASAIPQQNVFQSMPDGYYSVVIPTSASNGIAGGMPTTIHATHVPHAITVNVTDAGMVPQSLNTLQSAGTDMTSPQDGAPKSPRKNNVRSKKRKEPASISDDELEKQLLEIIETVTSPSKKSKFTSEEKRTALMSLEKHRTLRAQRQLAEEELRLVQKQLHLAEEQTKCFKIWTEIGNRFRGFIRP